MRKMEGIVRMAWVVMFVFAGFVFAGDTYWIGTVGNWSDYANWDNGEPDGWDDAYINNGGIAQIISGSNETCYRLYLGYDSGGNGAVELTGGSLSNKSRLYIGCSGTGQLNITNGGMVVNQNSCIGNESNSTGMVTVNGADSIWMTSSALFVGGYGIGELEIANEGFVSVAGGG